MRHDELNALVRDSTQGYDMTGDDTRNLPTMLKIAKVLEGIIFDRKSKKKHKLLAIELHLRYMDAAKSELEKRRKD